MDPILTPYPVPPPGRPVVLGWFKAYCILLCVIYLVFAGFSLVFFLGNPDELEMGRGESIVMGVIFLAS